MARELASQINIEAPSGAFPFGRILDDTGIGDGTPVDEAVYGDIHQFFAKMLKEAGITPNGLADSETDGFQLFQSLLNLSSTPIVQLHGRFDQRILAEDFGSGVLSFPNDIFIDKGLAYITDFALDKVFIFDINTLAQPALGEFGSGILLSPTSIFIDGNLAYVTDDSLDKVFIFNITTGAQHTLTDFGGGVLLNPQSVWVTGGKAYVVDPGGVFVFNAVTGAAIPAENFGSGILSSGADIFIIGDRAYVIDAILDKVLVFIISTQSQPVPSEDFGSGAITLGTKIHIIGNLAYIIDDAVKDQTLVFDIFSGAFLPGLTFNSGQNGDQALFIVERRIYHANTFNDKIRVKRQNLLINHI